jgi:hypothetical protein
VIAYCFALFKHCFILFHEENSDFSGCARTHSHQPSFAPDQKAERGAVGGLVGHVPAAAQEQVEREFGPLGHFQRQRREGQQSREDMTAEGHSLIF